MKEKTKMKSIKQFYGVRIPVGYCDLYYLLWGRSPNYYTCGVYGWNNDIYVVALNTVIVTGYRNLQGNVKYNHDIIENYNNRAKNIVENNNISFDSKMDQLDKLLDQFVKEVA